MDQIFVLSAAHAPLIGNGRVSARKLIHADSGRIEGRTGLRIGFERAARGRSRACAAAEDIEIHLDPRVAQLAVQQHRLAETHLAGTGKQEKLAGGLGEFRHRAPWPASRPAFPGVVLWPVKRRPPETVLDRTAPVRSEQAPALRCPAGKVSAPEP